MSHQFQVIVIGSGSAGKDAALLAGRAGLRTVLIEAGKLGGVCLHRGVPAVRALRACATQFEAAERSARLGTSVDLVESGWADWLAVQRRTRPAYRGAGPRPGPGQSGGQIRSRPAGGARGGAR